MEISLKTDSQLRKIRKRLGMTTRDVERLARDIAKRKREREREFRVSQARLVEIETEHSTPSPQKLYSLSVVYKVEYGDLLSLYGVDREDLARLHMEVALSKTNTVDFDPSNHKSALFDPSFSLEETPLLSAAAERCGDVLIAALAQLNTPNIETIRYRHVGLNDYTLHPRLAPGSLVAIDEGELNIEQGPYGNEYERPIYFVKVPDGCVCAWCDQEGDRLIIVPHPLSGCTPRSYAHPGEAQILGRVVAIAGKIAGCGRRGDDRPSSWQSAHSKARAAGA